VPGFLEAGAMTDPVRKSVSLAFVLALVYAIFGVLWVVASDTVLAMLVSDPGRMTVIQTWKGWLFVAISSALVFAVGNRLLRALEETEKRYRLLFDGNPDAIVLYDPKAGLLAEANAAAAQMLGFLPVEMRGRPPSDFLDESERSRFAGQSARSGDGETGETLWRLRRKDGSRLDVAVQGRPLVIDGRQLRLLLLTDVTVKLQFERELLRALDEVAAGNDRLRELGHAVSHDLQEPLRQISSYVQLLERRYGGRLDEDADQFIAFAVEGVRRLKSLIGDFSRYLAPTSVLCQTVAVGAVVTRALDDLRQVLTLAGASVAVGDLPDVAADPDKLTVVFHALIENAVKFRHPDRPCHVEVSGRPALDGWTFTVADNGIGIEPGQAEAVFTLFRRLHTRDSIPGNGTGLALARKLVESLGGKIRVDPVATGGSAFSFTLPGSRQGRDAASRP
jgi:PAS domain S-box-containing protein